MSAKLHSVADLSVPGAVGPLKSADLPHGFLPFFSISQVASDALDEIAAAARLLLQRDKST